MSTATALSVELSPSADSLDSYLSRIREIPVLSAEEEHELAVRLTRHNDLEAARRLVFSHLRFVAHIARGYRGYGLPLNDLIQEGNIGLMKAVKRYDPERKVRLVSFAVHWIRAEIHEFIIRNWRIVKVATTKAQRKMFFNLRSAKKHLGWFSREEVNAVAEDLGVTPETVMEMEGRLSARDVAFDGPDQDESDNFVASPAAFLQNNGMGPEQALELAQTSGNNLNQLHAALGDLDERSRDILAKRWLVDKKATLHQLADQYGVSAERIRQLEKNAINKLKVAMA